MNIDGNTSLPLSSDNILFNLFQCYLDAFGGTPPVSEQIDTFDVDQGYLFDLYTQTNKYLGEDLFILSSEASITEATTLTREVSLGQNTFNPFEIIPQGVSLEVPLSSTDLVSNGATAGSTLETADVIWQIVDGNIEGAWLRGVDTVFSQQEACFRLELGENESIRSEHHAVGRFLAAIHDERAGGLKHRTLGLEHGHQLGTRAAQRGLKAVLRRQGCSRGDQYGEQKFSVHRR